MNYCGGAWILEVIMWYSEIPSDNKNNITPIACACLKAGAIVSPLARYAPVIVIPNTPHSIGFCVLNQMIPRTKAHKITKDNPPKIESNGKVIVPNGSLAKLHCPTSQHEHCFPSFSEHSSIVFRPANADTGMKNNNTITGITVRFNI